jgi:hypothetical protein
MTLTSDIPIYRLIMGEEDSIKGENTLDDADSSSTPIKKKEIE